MAGEVSMDVARGLVSTGLAPGMVETEFGECVIAKSMYKATVIYTLTFTLVKEKWAVIGGQLVKAEYKEPEWLASEITRQAQAAEVESGKQAPLEPDEVESGPKAKEETEMEIKPSRKVRTIPELPKMKAAPLPKPPAGAKRIKEREKPAPKGGAKRMVNRVGTPTKIKLPVPMQKPPRVMPKIGPKPPRWIRQIGWNGHTEKIDTNLFPVPIQCANCGQTRWLDKRNAGIKDHPVTLCKPCAKKHKEREHTRRIRERNQAMRAEVEQKRAKSTKELAREVKKTLGLAHKALRKVAKQAQEKGKGAKGSKVPAKGHK